MLDNWDNGRYSIIDPSSYLLFEYTQFALHCSLSGQSSNRPSARPLTSLRQLEDLVSTSHGDGVVFGRANEKHMEGTISMLMLIRARQQSGMEISS